MFRQKGGRKEMQTSFGGGATISARFYSPRTQEVTIAVGHSGLRKVQEPLRCLNSLNFIFSL